MEYLILDEKNQQKGPFSVDQLKSQSIKRTSKVWCKGMEEWADAVTIDELKDLFDSPPPPNSPPPVPFSTELATPGDRFLAILIDSIAIFLVYFVPVVGWIVGIVYFLLKDALPFLNGQSLGKKVMKIRAVNQSTFTPITNDYGKSAIRNCSLYIPIFNIVDSFMVFGDDRLRFGDKWAKTTVVKEL